MRYTTTDGPKKPLNAIQEGSLGDKMGIAALMTTLVVRGVMRKPVCLTDKTRAPDNLYCL